MSEILLIRKGVQKPETRTTCGNHLLVLSLDNSYLPLQWSRVGYPARSMLGVRTSFVLLKVNCSPLIRNKPYRICPGIYAEGYIVFVFCLSVRMYVCMYVCMYVYSFIRSSVTLTKITSEFCVKNSQMGISQQPLIRQHSCLGHGYLGGSAYIP